MSDNTSEHESPLRRGFLDAARAILQEPDTPLDLRKVAERAGKSRTAPYLEFGKESEGGGLAALKMAVATEGFAELTQDLRKARARSRESARAMRKMAQAYLTFARREPRLYRLMFSEDIGRLLKGPELARADDDMPHPEAIRLLHARLQLQELVEAAVGQGLRERAVRTAPGTDLERQVVIFWAMLHGTALLMLDGQLDIALGRVTHEEAARLATEHLLIELDQSIVRSARAMDLAKRAKGQVAEEPEAPGVEARGLRPGVTRLFMKERLSRPREVEPAEGPAKGEPTEGLGEIVREELEEDIGGLFEQASTESEADAMAPAEDRLADVAEAASEYGVHDIARAPLEGRESDMSVWRAQFRAAPLSARAESARPPLPAALQRARSVPEVLVGARILWVDDHPEWQRAEREMLEALGVEVHMVPTTGSAVMALRRESFDLVISDMARGGVSDEGLRALPVIRAVGRKAPVVFYVGDLNESRGVPPGAFGITNQVEELLHLVLDALERGRIGGGGA